MQLFKFAENDDSLATGQIIVRWDLGLPAAIKHLPEYLCHLKIDVRANV